MLSREPDSQHPELTDFLVCGLGSLGQYCVSILKEFGVRVHGVDTHRPEHWEMPELPNLLDTLIIGDCCLPEILEQAHIRECRAILLITRQERVNLEAAFTARSLNPQIRLVVRSAQDRLNQLLTEQLKNFVAFEAAELPAPAFALAAMGGSTCGIFTLEDQMFRVMQIQVDRSHRWCDRRLLYELNTANRRVLSHESASGDSPTGLYQWDPTTRLQAGDRLTYIEVGSDDQSLRMIMAGRPVHRLRQRLYQTVAWTNIQRWLTEVQSTLQHNRPLQLAALCALVILLLLLLATLSYKATYPDMNWQEALNAALILALGGYGDVFGGLKLEVPLPWWLQLFSLGLTITGTIFVGILYAMLTERVLASRFQFLSRRPPIPRQNHTILVGMGQLGQQVAALLKQLKQPIVGISNQNLDADILPEMPLVVGDATIASAALAKVNLPTAKSLVVLTDDEVTNLEIGLLARTVNPDIQLVLRTQNPRFNQSLGRLLPYAKVLEANALAAEAFVAAAFGENVLNLFRLNNQTTLVTEYCVEENDTLTNCLLAEVAYGYGVVPILHQRVGREAVLLPVDDVRLQVGDRLVVLATITGLRRIEHGSLLPREWQVRLESVRSPDSQFEGGSAIARITGCELGLARSIMTQLPATLEVPLYYHQALRLVRALGKVQVRASLAPVDQVVAKGSGQ
jgi:Trk K+ transport system NAD-binding subunit